MSQTGMRLTILGCSGSFAGPGSAASCYLVEAAEARGRTWRILLDLGSGALGALQQYADADAVDAVFLSHMHPDHCLDLCGYYVMRKYHPGGALPPIPVWGPAGVAARMTRAYDLANEDDMSGEFDFHEYDGAVDVGPFRVEPIPVAHPVPAYGVRVTAGGHSLAYTGDTGPCDALDRLALGVDLVLAEASFREDAANPPDVHLTGRQAGEVAARNGVRRLVITHVPPWYDVDEMVAQARLVHSGEVSAAVPGATYDIS
jgi:ribonuclease BN (tRNA processing enzyme)